MTAAEFTAQLPRTRARLSRRAQVRAGLEPRADREITDALLAHLKPSDLGEIEIEP